MVPSQQRPTNWTEVILFREVVHRSLGGARFFQHVNNDVQPVRGASHDGGGGVGPTRTRSGHGWSMVPSCRQRPTSGTEAILFREVVHRSWGAARFFQHVNSNVQLARGAWFDAGGGGRPTRTRSGHGWSMVPSCRQRPTSGTEAIRFREVLQRAWGGAGFFQHVRKQFPPAQGARHDGGGGARHEQKV
jgi:hypothetical protein